MSLKYTTGARTRNVVNLAVPGGTTPAYSLTAVNSVPTGATAGFKNFNTQRMLHVLLHNDGATGGSGDNNFSNIAIWGYNSSLGGVWSILTRVDRAFGAETLVYSKYDNLAVAKDEVLRLVIPIEGIERIHVRAETMSGGANASGQLDIYLGVNSI